MSTVPGENKPQLPPASKPTLPPAPKLSLAGGVTKPSFKPEAPVAPAAPTPPAAPAFAPEPPPTLSNAPTIAASAKVPAGMQPVRQTTATPVATKAPLPHTPTKASLASIAPVDDTSVPAWVGGVSALSLVASVAAAVLLYLELKPTL